MKTLTPDTDPVFFLKKTNRRATLATPIHPIWRAHLFLGSLQPFGHTQYRRYKPPSGLIKA